MKRWIFSIAAAICLIFPTAASATFSIVACDQGGACGAAVATNNLAVGASVIYARARIGALATQFETNPNYGREALALLADGANANDVLKSLLANDGNFDGQDISYRQVGIVAATGDGVAYPAVAPGRRNGPARLPARAIACKAMALPDPMSLPPCSGPL
jgi:hypothetical protein